MLEQIIARLWPLVALLAVVIILSWCAALRTRRDLNLKRRTSVPRRKSLRGITDRRWEGQRKKK